MAGDPRPGRTSDYRLARIAAALALVSVLSLLLLIDALSPGYDMNPVTLTGLLASIGGLLGVEALRFLGIVGGGGRRE